MWSRRICATLQKYRQYYTQPLAHDSGKSNKEKDVLPNPEYDMEYICDPANRDLIHENIMKRKSAADIHKVLRLASHPTSESSETFLQELNKIPNRTDPEHQCDTEKILRMLGEKKEFNFEPVEFSNVAEHLRLLKMQSLSPTAGAKAYAFYGDLVQMGDGLIQYTIQNLLTYGFTLVSVPDILPTKVIERCGLLSDHGRTLVFTLDDSYGEYSLSGTAEMALAYSLMNRTFSMEELPLKLAAVSRCFRAETSKIKAEPGIYRVHQFTKVEMFACSTQEQSPQVFNELLQIQEHLFSSLGLHCKVIEMPVSDLGPAAYRKVDIEGWMPGMQAYGELSSCTNCTDYQSRRLNIKYKDSDGKLLHAHTLNGTGCALPRMLMALCETNQTLHRRIDIPDVLKPYMNGKDRIKKQEIPVMNLCKYKPPNVE